VMSDGRHTTTQRRLSTATEHASAQRPTFARPVFLHVVLDWRFAFAMYKLLQVLACAMLYSLHADISHGVSHKMCVQQILI